MELHICTFCKKVWYLGSLIKSLPGYETSLASRTKCLKMERLNFEMILYTIFSIVKTREKSTWCTVEFINGTATITHSLIIKLICSFCVLESVL